MHISMDSGLETFKSFALSAKGAVVEEPDLHRSAGLLLYLFCEEDHGIRSGVAVGKNVGELQDNRCRTGETPPEIRKEAQEQMSFFRTWNPPSFLLPYPLLPPKEGSLS